MKVEISEVANWNGANLEKRCTKRDQIAKEVIEKEELFNKTPFNNQIKEDWEDSLARLFIWCDCNWEIVNSYIVPLRFKTLTKKN